VFDGITLKGEFQGAPPRLLRWFFDVNGALSRRDSALAIYSLWLAAAFGLLAFVVVHDPGIAPLGPIWPLAVLALSALVVERQSVRLGPRAEVSVSFLPIVLAAVIYGPGAAILVSIASLASSSAVLTRGGFFGLAGGRSPRGAPESSLCRSVAPKSIHSDASLQR